MEFSSSDLDNLKNGAVLLHCSNIKLSCNQAGQSREWTGTGHIRQTLNDGFEIAINFDYQHEDGRHFLSSYLKWVKSSAKNTGTR